MCQPLAAAWRMGTGTVFLSGKRAAFVASRLVPAAPSGASYSSSVYVYKLSNLVFNGVTRKNKNRIYSHTVAARVAQHCWSFQRFNICFLSTELLTTMRHLSLALKVVPGAEITHKTHSFPSWWMLRV